MMERLGAGIDHPLLMTHPEGEYLKDYIFSRAAPSSTKRAENSNFLPFNFLKVKNYCILGWVAV